MPWKPGSPRPALRRTGVPASPGDVTSAGSNYESASWWNPDGRGGDAGPATPTAARPRRPKREGGPCAWSAGAALGRRQGLDLLHLLVHLLDLRGGELGQLVDLGIRP